MASVWFKKYIFIGFNCILCDSINISVSIFVPEEFNEIVSEERDSFKLSIFTFCLSLFNIKILVSLQF